MANGTIDISFQGYTFQFKQFTDNDLPVTTVAQSNLSYSSFGTGYLSGPAVAQKKMWTISAIVARDDIQDLEDLFNAWDSVRATGSDSAYIELVDGLLFSSAAVRNVVFTSPPEYSGLGTGGRTRNLIVSTVLMEI